MFHFSRATRRGRICLRQDAPAKVVEIEIGKQALPVRISTGQTMIGAERLRALLRHLIRSFFSLCRSVEARNRPTFEKGMGS
jgi:hypothetical protein